MTATTYWLKQTGRPGTWDIYNGHDQVIGTVTRDPDTYIWTATIGNRTATGTGRYEAVNAIFFDKGARR